MKVNRKNSPKTGTKFQISGEQKLFDFKRILYYSTVILVT